MARGPFHPGPVSSGFRLGLDTAIRFAGLHQSSSTDHLGIELVKHYPGGTDLWDPASTESLADPVDLCRGNSLGGGLSESTEPVRPGRVAFPYDLGANLHLAPSGTQSSAYRLQILRLGKPAIIQGTRPPFKGLKDRKIAAVPVEHALL